MALPAFPSNIKPVINQGYSWNMPNNVIEQPLTGGSPLLILDTKYGYVDFSVVIVGSLLKQQAWNDFYVNKIARGSGKFTMILDSGNGLEEHTCQIVPSSVSQGGPNDPSRIISYTVRAERTPFQEDPYGGGFSELYDIYGDDIESIFSELDTFVLVTMPTVFPPA